MKRSSKHASHRKVAPRVVKKIPQKNKTYSLAMALSFHVRLMRLAGHFLPDFDPESSGEFSFLRAIYSMIHMALMSVQFAAMGVEMARHSDDMSALTTNAITLLFFLHGPTKVFYFALSRRRFYKTICLWDSSNMENREETGILENKMFGRKMAFAEEEDKYAFNGRDSGVGQYDNILLFTNSNARFKQHALRKMRKLMVSVICGSALACAFWSLRPFLGLGHYGRTSGEYPAFDNATTMSEEAPGGARQWNLLVDATYPWDTSGDLAYALTFLYQLYWIVFCLAQINLLDLLFCSWLIFACEQIRHLKDILQPLMELSQVHYPKDTVDDISTSKIGMDMDAVLYPSPTSFTRHRIMARQATFSVIPAPSLFPRNADSVLEVGGGALQPVGIRMFQNNDVETTVYKATKYWVEKHKHVVRFVDCIGDCYGMALLIHMLTSTITLTLLSYEATKISSVDMHAFTVITYLFYTLGQVFLFCIYGNKLIEESTSVMQAAYDSPWYDCNEEAKAFIQIVCHQSQRPMSISGAKFFTVSLDLFASVLGAVVTYFMVLIQLK